MPTRTKPNVGRRRWSGALAAVTLLAAHGVVGAQGEDRSVSLAQARADHEGGRVVLIDIREPDEHATGIAAGARLLPMRQLAARLGEIPMDTSKPVLLICNTQNRSKAAADALRERGYNHVRYVHGGMSEWARRGWPMVKPDR